MPVRTRTFAVVTMSPVNQSVTILYVVPTGLTAIVRELTFTNLHNQPGRVLLGVRRGAVDCWVLTHPSLPVDSVLGGTPRYLVLHPGDKLVMYTHAYGGAPFTSSIYAAGVLLDGVAL